MRLKHVALFISITLLAGCSTISNLITTSPDVTIKTGFDGNGIAVLNFSRIGPIPNDSGKLTADKLADALFSRAKFNVIERSKVNDAQSSLELSSTESLSAEQIQKLGQKLKANYLVLGRIHCISNNDFFKLNEDKQLNISFRVISVSNQELIGVANYTTDYENDLVEQIEEMITRIVAKATE
ncbi:MAG: hypothetical protein FD122_2706 [Stygiobacter sp.]|nr:MAG: hypothetical protein FD122_2706 [Stygiobacter sp.]KAF0214121.1 MAG: hypothetical protein FD178_2707 [Ignavibacteria bacterium]